MSDRLRVRTFGPLSAWRGDTELHLGGPQQRVVLAVLLANVNRPIGREQLLDAVWGVSAPTFAVNLLQKHISGLRKVLEAGHQARQHPQILTWTGAAYLLTLPPDDLDLTCFEAEVSQADAARARGDLLAASHALERAILIFNGPPFDGLFSPMLDFERSRLLERLISVREARIEIDLQLKRERNDLLDELSQLVAEHPLRERLRGLQMMALYAAGRRAEAFSVFQDARTILDEELGAEPSAALQELHQRMLSADSTLEMAPFQPSNAPTIELRSAAGPPMPAQLPPTVGNFTGRTAELDRLRQLLSVSGGSHVGLTTVVITGTAGVGKSALAVHWAHLVREHFPDGQLHVNLRGFQGAGAAADPAEVLGAFLDAFGVSPEKLPATLGGRVALFRSIVHSRRVLVVLDNARDAEQVRALLPGGPGCLVIVTSRNQLRGLVADGAHVLVLDTMTMAEACEMLARRVGHARISAASKARDQIITSCARLPLALAIVAARLSTNAALALSSVAGELTEPERRLDSLESDDSATDVRVVFSWSYQLLTSSAQRMFRLVGLHCGPEASGPSLASMAGVPIKEARLALAELCRFHMVNETVSGRFVLHDLLRLYAVELSVAIDTEEERLAAQRRLLDHYLQTAYLADSLLINRENPIEITVPQLAVSPEVLGDPYHAAQWFRVELPVFSALIRMAVRAQIEPYPWQLTWVLGRFLEARASWDEVLTVARMAITSAVQEGDRVGQALMLRLLSASLVRLGQTEAAIGHLGEVLDIYVQQDSLIGQSQVHRDFAWVAEQSGRIADALYHAERSLGLCRRAGDLGGQGRALNALGWYRALAGEPREAIRLCEQALAIQVEIGDKFGQAETLDSLGNAFFEVGEADRGTDRYERAITLYRELGDAFNVADSLCSLGEAQATAGQISAARRALRDAAVTFDDLGHPRGDSVRALLRELQQMPERWSHDVLGGSLWKWARSVSLGSEEAPTLPDLSGRGGTGVRPSSARSGPVVQRQLQRPVQWRARRFSYAAPRPIRNAALITTSTALSEPPA